jgi:hypothetical protein
MAVEGDVSLLQAKLLTATEHPISSTSSLSRVRALVFLAGFHCSGQTQRPTTLRALLCFSTLLHPLPRSPPARPLFSCPSSSFTWSRRRKTKHISSACLAEGGALHLASSRT